MMLPVFAIGCTRTTYGVLMSRYSCYYILLRFDGKMSGKLNQRSDQASRVIQYIKKDRKRRYKVKAWLCTHAGGKLQCAATDGVSQTLHRCSHGDWSLQLV